MASKRLSADGASEILQFKVTLRHVRPSIWRRFQVPSHYTLAALHEVLQVVMGWWNSHLHEFRIGETRWGEPDDDFGSDVVDERSVTIADLELKVKARLVYTYDFGDTWEHDLVLEKVISVESRPVRAAVIAGKRAAPPEDCGGPWGYANLCHVLAHPRHKEHAEMKEWAGEIEPDEFDVEELNAELKQLR